MRPGMSPLTGDVGGGVGRGRGDLPRTAGRTPRALEGLDVFGEDGPDRSHFGPVQALAGQETAHIGLRRLELGGRLGNRK
jgi:hypothetical protein